MTGQDKSGQVRTVDISKKGTRFCPHEEIEDLSNRIFTRLHKCDLFAKLDRKQFIIEVLQFYCITNHLHPFREGNGRTQRIFITQLSLSIMPDIVLILLMSMVTY